MLQVGICQFSHMAPLCLCLRWNDGCKIFKTHPQAPKLWVWLGESVGDDQFKPVGFSRPRTHQLCRHEKCQELWVDYMGISSTTCIGAFRIFLPELTNDLAMSNEKSWSIQLLSTAVVGSCGSTSWWLNESVTAGWVLPNIAGTSLVLATIDQPWIITHY